MKKMLFVQLLLLTCLSNIYSQSRSRSKGPDFYSDSMYHKITRLALNTIIYSDVSSVLHQGNLYFMSTRPNPRFGSMVNYTDRRTGAPYYALFTAEQYDSVNFGKIKPYGKELLGKYNTGPVYITPDGKTMYLTRNILKKSEAKMNRRTKEHTYVLQIFQYQYNEKKKSWDQEKAFPYNSKDYSCGYAFISPDGDKLYFNSDMPGSYGGLDLYVCQRQGSVWGEPRNMGKHINTGGNEIYPSLDPSGEKLYYASDGLKGMGGYDIFVADPVVDIKQEPKNMGYPVNTEYDDFGLVYYDRELHGYFSSSRPVEMKEGNKTIYDRSDHIYYLYSTVPPVQTYRLEVLDSITRQPLISTVTFIRSTKPDQPVTITSGTVPVELELYPRNEYTVNYTVGNFGEKSMTLTPSKEESLLTLEYYLPMKVSGTVRNRSGKAIFGANVIAQANSGRVLEAVTNEQGYYELEGLIAGESYQLEYRSNGYESGFDGLGLPEDVNSLEPEYIRDMELRPVRKFVMPDNILFDVGKYDLKLAALVELDKLASMLIDNPNISVEVGAHTDSRGTAAFNNKLSLQRAKSVVDYLVYKGVDSKRIKSRGYGFSRLVNRCKKGVRCSEEEHAANRRVEFTFTEKVQRAAARRR